MNLTDRISLLEICNREFPGGIAVEVGVAGGHFARQILETWKNVLMLTLVDPWKHFDESEFEDGYVDGYNLDAETQEARYKDIVAHFSSDPKVHILRLESKDAAVCIDTKSCDFVYIDANHCYKAVKRDMDQWWTNVKSGGILAGHDYYNQPPFTEVKKAVDEFAAERKLKVHVTKETYSRPSAIYGASWEGPSWAIRKP